MKKVILFGDSIRIGYQDFVKDSFKGIADVFFPETNCAFAQNLLRYANIWKDECNLPEDADVVHWNAGAWDALHIYDDDALTSIEFYSDLIVRIHKRLKLLFPNAKQIFATTTAGVDEAYTFPYHRYNSEIEKFNTAAINALKPYEVGVNDLYEITRGLTADSACRSDMTHFNTEDGIKLIGTKVVEEICVNTGIDFNDVRFARAAVKNVAKEILRN